MILQACCKIPSQAGIYGAGIHNIIINYKLERIRIRYICRSSGAYIDL